MKRKIVFAISAFLICLMLGCSKKAEKSETEPKFESSYRQSASLVKQLPPIEQRIMSLEDIEALEALRIAEIICTPCSDAQTDVNAPKTDIKVDWRIRIDGKLGPKHDDIGTIAFRPQADRIAYAAKHGSKYHLIVDGNVESSEYDSIEYITFSPDGRRIAYGARIGNKWIAVVDGNAGPEYDLVSNFAFSPDSKRFIYTAGKQNGSKQTVVLDGVEICPAYDAVGLPVFSSDSKRTAFTAENNFKKFMVVDGKPDGIYDAIAEPFFSPDSQHYAYFAMKDNEKFIVFDGNAEATFEHLPKQDILFGPNDNSVAYVTGFDGKWFVIVNGNAGPLFDSIGDKSLVLSVDGERHAYTAHKDENWCVVVNDQPGPLYDAISADGPVFSPDGKHFAYGVLLDDKVFITLNHQLLSGYGSYDSIGHNSIAFTSDSRYLIYQVLKDKKWHMAVNGQLGPAYDKFLAIKPTITENTIEYFAERDGWLFRSRSKIVPKGQESKTMPVDTDKAPSDVEMTVVSNEQRLMPLQDSDNLQRVVYIGENVVVALYECLREKSDELVLVLGGTFRNTRSSYYGKNVTVSDFYIGRYEVTQKEWVEVMGSNPSKFKGDDLPVEMVSWYDCIEYCNAKSIKEGLEPYYNIDKDNRDVKNIDDEDDLKWTVTINAGANGYRLPTEIEWEYAAGGGQLSKSYKYSGSNELDEVGWYWQNSGDEYLKGFWNWPAIQNNKNRTQPVGRKNPNELGLYDMSGNVREWCWDWYWDWYEDFGGIVWKGGGWLGSDFCCEPSFRANLGANRKHYDTGFRLARDK